MSTGLVRESHERRTQVETGRGSARAEPLQSHRYAIEQCRVRRRLEVSCRKSHESGPQVHSVVTPLYTYLLSIDRYIIDELSLSLLYYICDVHFVDRTTVEC